MAQTAATSPREWATLAAAPPGRVAVPSLRAAAEAAAAKLARPASPEFCQAARSVRRQCLAPRRPVPGRRRQMPRSLSESSRRKAGRWRPRCRWPFSPGRAAGAVRGAGRPPRRRGVALRHRCWAPPPPTPVRRVPRQPGLPARQHRARDISLGEIFGGAVNLLHRTPSAVLASDTTSGFSKT